MLLWAARTVWDTLLWLHLPCPFSSASLWLPTHWGSFIPGEECIFPSWFWWETHWRWHAVPKDSRFQYWLDAKWASFKGLLCHTLFPSPHSLWIRKDVCSYEPLLDRPSAWKKAGNCNKGARMGEMGRSPATELAFIPKVSGYLISVPHTQDLQSKTQVWADLPWSHSESEIDCIQCSQNTQLHSSTALTAFYVNECTTANMHWAPTPDAKAMLCTKPGLCSAQAQLAISCTSPPISWKH